MADDRTSSGGQRTSHQRLLDALAGVDELTQRHVIVVEDSDTEDSHIFGPFPDPLTAMRVAEELEADLLAHDPTKPVKAGIKPLYEPTTSTTPEP